MKKNIINCLLLIAILIAGCKKSDKRYPFDVALSRVPYVNVIQDPAGSAAIDVLNLGVFSGKFNLTLLYGTDIPPSKVDIVIKKNGVNSSAKIFQAGVATFPSQTFTITAAQIAALFGAPIVLGDNYDIGTDIYTADGTMYPAFPTAGGVNLLAYSGTGQANQPGFVPTIRFSAICAYDPLIYQGNFVVVSDAFGDFSPGEVVPLTKVSNTSFSFIDPYVTNPLPIIVQVNTLNNVVSITKQKIGDKFVWATYTNPNAAASGATVSPCAKTVTLAIVYTVDQGSFGGPFNLVLRKQ